ncbi:MAG: DUF192 domain-containing protein [Alphaproteobacteria bacterium]
MLLRLVALLALFCAGCQATAQPQPPLPREALVVETAGGARYAFEVEMAITPEQRKAGLMFRTEMAADHGMLFDFGAEDELAFWMKNTPLSLDIIFIRGDGTIVNIHRKTTPYSTESLPSDGPARAALELNAGTARALGIKPGDVVRHRIFAN